VAQHIGAHLLDVLGHDEIPAHQERVGPGAHLQGDGAARRRAESDEPRHVESVVGGTARGEHDVEDVVHDPVVDVHLVGHDPQLLDALRHDHLLELDLPAPRQVHGHAFPFGHPLQDLLLGVLVRVRDEDLHQKAVHLRFGQRVGALLLDGVLGGQHEERIGEGKRLLADGHLFLLHGFQQGRLHLGGRPVDFVGQEHVGEDGPLAGLEGGGLGVEDHGPDQVGGEQVRRELDPLEVQVQHLGQRAHRHALGQAGHALDEDVAAGEQSDEEAVEQLLLPDDPLLQLAQDALNVKQLVLDIFPADGELGGGHGGTLPQKLCRIKESHGTIALAFQPSHEVGTGCFSVGFLYSFVKIFQTLRRAS